MIEDIDAEVDKLVVLEGFYEPLPYVPFFTLRDDEDLSSEEEEEVKDLLCRHQLHRKSRSPLTGKLSPMALETSTGRSLPWLRQSFIDKNEKKRVEKLYKLRKSIIRKETLAREAIEKKQSFFIIHRQSSLKNLVERMSTLEGEETHELDDEESDKLYNIGGNDHIDKDGHDLSHDHDHITHEDHDRDHIIYEDHDHDHINHKDHDHEFLDSSESDDEIKIDIKPKETPNINIQKLTCNQFELDFENVLVGEKKELSLMLYNGANFPVTFKIDKTRANSKGFNIQPDKILVLPGEPNNDRATKLQISFQNITPKLPLGPIHVWVQMNVKEVY